MKISANFAKKAFILCLTLLAFLPNAQSRQPKPTGNPAPPQQPKPSGKQVVMNDMVHQQDFVFKAQTAMPMTGSTRHLTSDYDLKVTKESVVSYLPYFGRAYSAPIDPSKGGIQFTSKDFSYTVTDRKKGGWDVVIKPKDYRDVQQMTLTISVDGYATLQVTSLNRQPISFNGTVAQPKKK